MQIWRISTARCGSRIPQWGIFSSVRARKTARRRLAVEIKKATARVAFSFFSSILFVVFFGMPRIRDGSNGFWVTTFLLGVPFCRRTRCGLHVRFEMAEHPALFQVHVSVQVLLLCRSFLTVTNKKKRATLKRVALFACCGTA